MSNSGYVGNLSAHSIVVPLQTSMKYDPKNILKVSFLHHESNEERHLNFLRIFEDIINDDLGRNHLILIRKYGTIGFSYSFPFEALEKYPLLIDSF